ncbi:MAG: VCBS repeat-containing protein [Myxococcota bacterium]|nr:VCBS repeat-containing protein [Myxococcota bacterium]
MAFLSSRLFVCFLASIALACGDGSPADGSDGGDADTDSDSDTDADIDADTDSDTELIPVAEPQLIATLYDRWHEGWLASPAVADIDEDGTIDIIVARHNRLIVWHLDNAVVFSKETVGRIWSSPVVWDLVPHSPGQEIAVASRDTIYLWDALGNAMPGFPVTWRDEMRSIAAGDIDGDGELELVAGSTRCLNQNNQNDWVIAFNTDGSVVNGFPPNTTGASGCDDACYVTGGFDQNLAVGDVNNDGVADIFATQDNAYLSLHQGDGWAFEAADIFSGRTKFLGIRFLHDYALAQQGWPNNGATDNQAHFTNSAPAMADVDGDGTNELVVLGSVQNANQDDRLRGVGLWVIRSDGTRLDDWAAPFHAPDYLAGLWDFDGTNVVGATNRVTVVDLNPSRPGPEFVFAGFDGRIHCVDAARDEVWATVYTEDDRVLTGGVLAADLSTDRVAELVFTTYSPDEGKGALVILNRDGEVLYNMALPGRGAMAVPTIADVNGNGTMEITISLKDGEDGVRQVLIYEVPGSDGAALPWPTGRANYLRNGAI